MNQGVVHSSVPVQQMVAATTPNWWSINNMKPPPHNQHQYSFLAAPQHNYFPGPHHLISSAASWNDHGSLQEPESWSQLILGGSVGEIDKPGLSNKRLENWEQQFLNQSSNSSVVDVIKPENSANNYTNCWSQSHQMLSASSASPKSSVTTLSSNLLDFTHSHKSPDPQLPDPSISECNSTSTGGVAKKARIQSSSAQSTFKVRKEKLGDRITALHQLVSPFGKTDTASVLLEAIGYIRFLQSQVEALSLPYLQGTGTRNNISQPHQVQGNRNCLFPQFPAKELSGEEEDDDDDEDEEGKKEKKDLKSRGLCLVPISSTLHFGSDNGADYWAPAFGGNFQ